MSAAFLVSCVGWTLLRFVWQGATIGCVTAILLATLRRARPETRYAIACVSLLGCVTWPAVDLAALLSTGHVPRGAPLFPAAATARAVLADAGGLPAWLLAHLGWIVGLWAACVGALALRMALGLLWIGRAGRAHAADPAWQARLSALAARCGLDRAVRLRIVDGLASPITAGWWRPVVLVPAALVSGMPAPLLEALLAHELGHVRRHDYLVNLAQNVAETLLFYHPAVWWLSRRIRQEREQIADDFAVRHLGEPRRLARALSELERLQFSHHHLAQAANGGDLMLRIRRLLRVDAPAPALDWKAALPVLALATACATSVHALALREDGVGARALHALSADATAGLTRRPLADFNTCAKPVYPPAELSAGHTGTVTVLYLVEADGTVSDSKVGRSSGYTGLDEAARGAIARCHFTPALAHGEPVKLWQPVQYVWTLD